MCQIQVVHFTSSHIDSTRDLDSGLMKRLKSRFLQSKAGHEISFPKDIGHGMRHFFEVSSSFPSRTLLMAFVASADSPVPVLRFVR